MKAVDSMKLLSIASNFSGEHRAKHSVFLAYLYPFSKAMLDSGGLTSRMDSLKREHKNARHIVSALRVLHSGGILESSSDAKEPRGSAGRPMLEVLSGQGMIEVLCICVRYFGGVKLGVGGLARAYARAAMNALDEARALSGIVEYVPMDDLLVCGPLGSYSKLRNLIKSLGVAVMDEEFLESSFRLVLRGDASILSALKPSLHSFGVVEV